MGMACNERELGASHNEYVEPFEAFMDDLYIVMIELCIQCVH